MMILLSEVFGQKDCIQAQMQKPKLYARSALLMDASNGRVLFEENGYKQMPNASTTKIMTCILAIEYLQSISEEKFGENVLVSKNAANMPKVHLGMREGERYMLKDLLYSLMLESHNDTAVAIAEHIAGSVENFATLMNKKAKEIGCMCTHFITPNGLDSEKDGKAHLTSAYDLGLMTSYAMKNELFLEIINTRNKTISTCDGARRFSLQNKDAFLDMMEGACGVKTGFTSKAGYCFVGALKRGDKNLIAVVLACGWPPNKNWKWADTKQLMEYGLQNYDMRCIAQNYAYEKEKVAITDGIKEQVSIYLDVNRNQMRKELSLLLSEEDQIKVKRKWKHNLVAPIQKGTIIGFENYEINNVTYKSYPIKCQESVNLRTYFYCVRQIFMLYFIRM